MKSAYVLLAAVTILSSAACDAKKGNATESSAPIKAVAPPKGGDWTKMVSQTDAGGFVMGNPNADVKLIEYGSMTCPHCAEFNEKGVAPLIANYVKSGRVSYEFRNFVRDPLDLTMSLITRCAGPERFFVVTDALYKDQRSIFDTLQGTSKEQQEQLQQLPPEQQFARYAQLAGLQQWAAQRGLPSAKTSACLANQQEVNRLVQMNNDTTNQYSQFTGTPGFVINGKFVEETATWDKLEPQLREALGERG